MDCHRAQWDWWRGNQLGEGSHSVNVLPSPCLLTTSILPPCSSAKSLAIAPVNDAGRPPQADPDAEGDAHEHRYRAWGGLGQHPGSGGHEQGPPDLLVVVYAAGTRPDEHLARLGRRARDARIGVALYCFDDRRFELVPAADLERWTKEQRRRRIVLGWSRRLPAVWNRVVRRLVAS